MKKSEPWKWQGGSTPPPQRSKISDPNAAQAPTAILADDSFIMRGRLRQYLNAAGCRIIGEAANALEAQRMGQNLRPDIAVLDILMPPGSGLDAALQLKIGGFVTHVVVVSSNSQDVIFKPLVERGIHVLTKPLSDQQFLAKMKVILNGVDR
jgi:DNA-binding NarL/FixJ family response regulator